VGQAVEDLEALLDDAMALLVLDVADEADAAGVSLLGRIVEALCWGIGTKVHGVDLTETGFLSVDFVFRVSVETPPGSSG
jgi:hypothetical protein